MESFKWHIKLPTISKTEFIIPLMNRLPQSNFFHGRTETVRSVTKEAVELTKVWCNESSSDSEKENALRIAVETHVRLMQQCKNGLGVDRHLFGLFNLARFNQQSLSGYAFPALFEDEAYSLMTSSILSTSNCGTPQLSLFGFGPVVQNGYGIAYFLKDDRIPITITSFERPTEQFCELVRQTLLEIRKVLRKNSATASETNRSAA